MSTARLHSHCCSAIMKCRLVAIPGSPSNFKTWQKGYETLLFLQLVLALWILIPCQTSLEVALGGHYNPELPCFYEEFFSREVLLGITIVSPVYGSVPFIMNIAIFLKVILRRNELGKFTSKF